MSRTTKIVLIGIAIILAFQFLRVTIGRGQDIRQPFAASIVSSCLKDILGFSPEQGRRRCECFRDAIMPLISDDEIRRGGTTLSPQMVERMKIAASLCTDK